MATLSPCPGCTRHVRTTETSCPFCATAMPESFATPPGRPRVGRVRRGVAYALGAAAVAAAASGCTTSTGGEDLGPADASVDYGSSVDLYGAPDMAPPRDLGTDMGGLDAAYGGPPDAGPQDGGVDSGPVVLYGAPPG